MNGHAETTCIVFSVPHEQAAADSNDIRPNALKPTEARFSRSPSALITVLTGEAHDGSRQADQRPHPHSRVEILRAHTAVEV